MNVRASPTLPLLELDNLRTIVAIAETGSFSSAAAAVFRTPSAISMQVKKIEDLLGRPVFVRDSRSVALTRDGEYLLEHARRMLALNREALARFVAPEVQGEVRLGATDTLSERVLPHMLRRFAETHPNVTVDVTVDSSRRMAEMVASRQLDLALVTCGQDGTGSAEVLVRERLVWAMAACGVAAERDPLPVSVWEEGCAWRKAGLDALAGQGREWRVVFKTAHISAQLAAIRADLALAPIAASALGSGVVEAPERYGLPALPDYGIGLLVGTEPLPPVEAAADHLRATFSRV
jgi:DNA-binding transcriptional LysR family regulator